MTLFPHHDKGDLVNKVPFAACNPLSVSVHGGQRGGKFIHARVNIALFVHLSIEFQWHNVRLARQVYPISDTTVCIRTSQQMFTQRNNIAAELAN